MRVWLRNDIEKIGMAGEIVNVKDGFGRNYLIARSLAVEVTDKNKAFYETRATSVDQRKEVIASQTSMQAEKINNMQLVLKRKMHDNGKLYGSINPAEIVDLLALKGISISKSQVVFGKSIKEQGEYKITIKLSSRLQPQIILKVTPE